MTIAINGTKTGQQNLLDLLNAANPGKGFTSSNVSFSAPTAEVSGSNNTLVTVTALSNQGYSGSKAVNYTRLAPGIAHGHTGAMKVTIAPTDNQTQILGKIVAAMGVIVADVTITGNGAGGTFNIPANEDDTSCTFTVTANSGSLVYVGDFTAQLTVPDVDVDLEDAIETTDLGGFTAG